MARSPWPDRAVPLCGDILKAQEQIVAILDLCLDDGIGEGNYNLVVMLLPHIEKRALEIKESCRQIQKLLPPRRVGRFPKWVTVTMDITAIAMQILKAVELAEEHARIDRFINVEHILKYAKQATQRIVEIHSEYPCPKYDIPESFEEYINDLTF